MHTTLTFNQMERSADRTLAVVLWAKHARNVVVGLIWFAVLNRTLTALVRSLSDNEKLDSMSDEQTKELTVKLQKVHEQIVGMLDLNEICLLRRKPVFRVLIQEIEERAEDLSDIIDDFVLSCNSEFRAIVADSVKSVSSAHSAEPVGRV